MAIGCRALFSGSNFLTEVEIVERDGSKFVILHQPLFINKVREVTWCYGIDYPNHKIIDHLNRSTKFKGEVFRLKHTEVEVF